MFDRRLEFWEVLVVSVVVSMVVGFLMGVLMGVLFRLFSKGDANES